MTPLKVRLFVLFALVILSLGYAWLRGSIESKSPLASNASSVVQTASTLRVHFIDVAQGDSILIEAPDSSTALIDGSYDNGMALAYL
jgi:beta-lactamase superfamily II metal-dependent hydrolase